MHYCRNRYTQQMTRLLSTDINKDGINVALDFSGNPPNYHLPHSLSDKKQKKKLRKIYIFIYIRNKSWLEIIWICEAFLIHTKGVIRPRCLQPNITPKQNTYLKYSKRTFPIQMEPHIWHWKESMHHDYNECYALQTTEKKMKQSKNKNKNKEEGKGKDGKLIKIS